MKKPNLKSLMEAVPISKSYAAVILKDGADGAQTPPLNLAALIYCKTGWRHSMIAEMSARTLKEIAEQQPWTPPKEKVA